MTSPTIRYLGQKDAIQLDEELMGECGYKLEQLMELAGLSCASSILEAFPQAKKILIVVGPGNNGGDGLVCARHLKLFGYEPEIFIPKALQKDLYLALANQCSTFEIPILSLTPQLEEINQNYHLIVDALFGFSFKPPVRPEFSAIMTNMINSTTPCCSIDIPSGWDVEKGPTELSQYLKPKMLISLTAPKLCAKFFNGEFHYLGGRFVPPKIEKKYDLNLPQYLHTTCCYRLS
uniref:NAD(P)H-hydrate epimerase n=1 Tax=Moina brachiata TaxID=675436 RepID=A0A4Y7NKS2_9CRUS|nr:EOG090X0AXR [Moina brachiata]SVE93187.1 EOG090X0AXR [Moina brachiata]